jgi:hypothetical protein
MLTYVWYNYQMELYSAIRSPFAEVTPRLAPERVRVERILFAFGLEQVYAIISDRRRHLHLPYTELDDTRHDIDLQNYIPRMISTAETRGNRRSKRGSSCPKLQSFSPVSASGNDGVPNA